MVDIHVQHVTYEDIVFKPSDEQIQADCHQPYAGHENGCANYGTTYGCPPHAPKLAEFKEILAAYTHFYLVYGEVELAGDPKQDKAIYATMQEHVDAFVNFMQDSIPDLFIIHGYGCHYCERVGVGKCTCPKKPCRHPGKRTYSLSVALDIVSTMNSAGISMEMNPARGTKVFRRIGFVASKLPVDIDERVKEFELDVPEQPATGGSRGKKSK
ncbi:MAG: hypothetical protein GYA24_04115 [Candidatus Lokiarchaeota archaeon]|nr:hypothetical protein [Candidatus Lokiarchaeota archaeon]